MATIRFYGNLQRHGRKFKLDVLTAGEALKALMIQIPGLRQEIQHNHYRVRIAGKDIDTEQLHNGMQDLLPKNAIIHVIPQLAGAKRNGLVSVVIGAAMIIAAFYTGGSSMAAWGTTSSALFSAGLAMTMSGAVAMLTKIPKTELGKSGESNKSTSFSNLDNALSQGRPIPLCYGEVMIGSQALSQGLSTQ